MVLGKQKEPRTINNVGMNREEEDKISNLPDALIHHIYSFLPTKCVLSTCILSKRWMNLSNSVPILDFSESQTHLEDTNAWGIQKIMNIVDTVLFVHDKPKIQKFSLSVDIDFDETRVHRWIKTVITRKVEEFVLSITSGKPFVFPLSLFKCDSLTMLNLELFSILNLPNTISFPKLKILQLTHIEFADANLTGQLFSNCPILEDLSLVTCQFHNLEVLCITSCTLKHLSIVDGYLHESTLKISAPNLLTIEYASEVPADFVLGSFPLLVKADIYNYSNQPQEGIYASLIKLYKELSNVKLLKVSGSSFLGLSAANLLLDDMPTFHNLVTLEFSSAFLTSWDPYGSYVSSVSILMRFLRLSPNLESIEFTKGVYYGQQDDSRIVNFSPQYSLPNLKSVVIREFSGYKVELGIVKFFLASAGVLQTMTITISPRLSKDYKKQTEIASELLKFPRSSTICVLEFLAPE